MTASDKPNTVHLTYSQEDGSWWAESEQMPSLFAGGDTLDDAQDLARQAVRDEFGDGVTIFDWLPVPAALRSIIASKGADQSLQAPTTGSPEAAIPPHEWSLPKAVS